jgi:hypothetical protein
MEHFFINTIPSQYHAIQKALKLLNEQHPGRPIVLLNEFGFFGSLPLFAGAPGLRPTAQIGIGIIPVVLSSIDVAPAGLGLLPDTS